MSKWTFICANAWTVLRVRRTLDAMVAAIDTSNVDHALETACASRKLFSKGKFVKTGLLGLIAIWQALATRAHSIGAGEVAGECLKISELLQRRFDAGDYHPDL